MTGLMSHIQKLRDLGHRRVLPTPREQSIRVLAGGKSRDLPETSPPGLTTHHDGGIVDVFVVGLGLEVGQRGAAGCGEWHHL